MSKQTILSSRCRNGVSNVTSIKCSSHWVAKEFIDSECLGLPITVPKTLETHTAQTQAYRVNHAYGNRTCQRPIADRHFIAACPTPFLSLHTHLWMKCRILADLSLFLICHRISCIEIWLLTYFPCYWELSVRNVKDVNFFKGVQLCTTSGPCNECYYSACSHVTSLCHCMLIFLLQEKRLHLQGISRIFRYPEKSIKQWVGAAPKMHGLHSTDSFSNCVF